MMRVVIIEDEKHSRETLKNLLSEYCSDVEIVGLAGTINEAVQLINSEKPELIFLDIELQTGTGFDVLQQIIPYNFDVIFTTAFEHYAIKAIKFSSIDYLLKPIDVDELVKALEKAKKKKYDQNYQQQLEVLLNNLNKQPGENRRICLSTSDGIEFINIKDIIYCEANGSYTTFHLKNKRTLLLSKHLKEYENLLAEHQFMRVHNSFLINLFEVKKFVKSEGGYILMNNDAQISISPKNRDLFMEKMTHLI